MDQIQNKKLDQYINQFDISKFQGPTDVKRINSKIYKHYRIVSPQGCAISPTLERSEFVHSVKRNFLKQKPKVLSQYLINNLNSTFHQNQQLLNSCHKNKKVSNLIKKQTKNIKYSFATQQLQKFNDENQANAYSRNQSQKQKMLQKLLSHELINNQDVISMKKPDQLEKIQNSPKALGDRNTCRKLSLNNTSGMVQLQTLVSSTDRDQLEIKKRFHTPQNKGFPYEIDLMRFSQEKLQTKPSSKKTNISSEIINECMSYHHSIKNYQKLLRTFQVDLASKTNGLIQRLTPLPQQKQNSDNENLLLSTEQVHNYLIQQNNRSRTVKEKLTPDQELMNQYEIKLLSPHQYGNLLLGQRKKQFRKDRQKIKINRFVEEKRLMKTLNLADFLGFE